MVRRSREDYAHVPMVVIRRLPKYYRYLADLIEEGVERISSQKLARMMGISASQLRQDLNQFGEFGQQGYGYRVKQLYEEIGGIIGLVEQYNMVLVGAGNLGQALANYPNFQGHGFQLQAMFDINPKLIGLRINNIEIKDIDQMHDFVRNNQIYIGIIAVPKDAAQDAADRLVAAGVQAIWNFAPVDINVPEGVIMESEHLVDRLMVLAFRLQNKLDKAAD